MDDHHVILVKALEQSEGYEDAQQIARVITDTLNMEAMASVRVAYGTIVQELKEVPRSYQEAQVALEMCIRDSFRTCFFRITIYKWRWQREIMFLP